MKEQEITLRDEVKITAKGKRHDGRTKAVIDKTTQTTYASIKDAAEALGVHYSVISSCCRGKVKTAKNHRFCYANDIEKNIEDILESMKVDRALLEKYQEEITKLIEEKEAQKKKEEERKKKEALEKKREIAIEKACSVLLRAQQREEKEKQRYERACERTQRAESKLHSLTA